MQNPWLFPIFVLMDSFVKVATDREERHFFMYAHHCNNEQGFRTQFRKIFVRGNRIQLSRPVMDGERKELPENHHTKFRGFGSGTTYLCLRIVRDPERRIQRRWRTFKTNVKLKPNCHWRGL